MILHVPFKKQSTRPTEKETPQLSAIGKYSEVTQTFRDLSKRISQKHIWVAFYPKRLCIKKMKIFGPSNYYIPN